MGEERGTKGTPIVWKGSLGPDFFEEPVYQFLLRARVISLKSALSDDTITGRKIGRNACMVRTAWCRCSPRGSMEVVASSNTHEHG